MLIPCRKLENFFCFSGFLTTFVPYNHGESIMTQREIIIEQAAKMFVSQGIKAVRMDDIAQALSVSKRTLYELFGDKEELIYQSVKLFADQCHEGLIRRVYDLDNCLEIILVSLRDMVATAPVAGRMRRNLRRFYPQVYARLEEEVQQHSRSNLHHWLNKCVECGYMEPTSSCDFVVNILHDSVQGTMVYDDNGTRDPMEIISLMAYSLVIFVRGLCTSKGIEIIDRCFDKYFGNIPSPDALVKE